ACARWQSRIRRFIGSPVTNAAIAAPMERTGEEARARMRASGVARRASGLVERLAFETPAEPVRRAQQAAHADTMILGVASRIARDDDVVTGPEGIARDALPRKLAGSAPFDAPALHFAVLVRRHDMHPGMRIAEHELDQLALDLDFLALVVRRRERVMRRSSDAGHQRRGHGHSDQFALHSLSP